LQFGTKTLFALLGQATLFVAQTLHDLAQTAELHRRSRRPGRRLLLLGGLLLVVDHLELALASPAGSEDARNLARGVELTRDQVRNSPDIDADKPVTRQKETTYFDYYGYPRYWTGPYVWGLHPTTLPPPVAPNSAVMDQATQATLDRRARERDRED